MSESLALQPVRFVLVDEVDRYPQQDLATMQRTLREDLERWERYARRDRKRMRRRSRRARRKRRGF